MIARRALDRFRATAGMKDHAAPYGARSGAPCFVDAAIIHALDGADLHQPGVRKARTALAYDSFARSSTCSA